MRGGVQPLFCCLRGRYTDYGANGGRRAFIGTKMNKDKIHDLLEEALALRNEARVAAGAAADLYEVDTIVSPRNVIRIFIDAESGVTIDDCVPISRHIEGGLDRDREDFEIEVSSAGLDRPLKKARQYRKHIGRRLKLTDRENNTWKGTVVAADEEGVTLRCDPPKGRRKKAVQAETGVGAPETENLDRNFPYGQIKEARIEIVF